MSIQRRILTAVEPSPTRIADEAHQKVPYALDLGWASQISEDDWQLYLKAIHALRAKEVQFMLGGGFAQAAFTGRWRNTKDIDFYILPGSRETAIAALTQAGFADYYERLPYDRKWIYRSTQREVIVDIIWSMANQRAQVDSLWLERAGEVTMRGQTLKMLPMEEFLWCKLYILQRDRCDWIDVFNVVAFHAESLDWDHFIARIGDDLPLLRGLLTAFSWISPESFSRIPSAVRERLRLQQPSLASESTCSDRIRLLDSRHWFAPETNRGERLQI